MITAKKSEQPLVVIVGPTASGKTTLSIELAEKYGGEIISADSRAIYRDLNVGVAKPTHHEQLRVPHWGIDLVSPGQYFSAADFKLYAVQKIKEIRSRGKVPFLVGGTGLYIDAVLFDYTFGTPADAALRKDLELKSVEELQEYCNNSNIILPRNYKNKRHLIRAIEQKNTTNQKRTTPIENSIVVGISTSSQDLRHRIDARSRQLFADNVVKEATKLGETYGWGNEALTGNIYPIVKNYLDGEIDYNTMVQKNSTADWRLAKRQLTWFRRNPYIKWLNNKSAQEYIENILANEQQT